MMMIITTTVNVCDWTYALWTQIMDLLHTISKNPSFYDYNDIAQGQTTILTEFFRVDPRDKI